MSDVTVAETTNLAAPATHSPEASIEAAAALLRGESAPEATQPEPTPKEASKPSQSAEEAKIAKSFAALSRQEKRFKQQVDEWKAEKAKIDAELAELRSVKEALSANDIAKLEASGFSFEEAARRVLNGDKPSPESKLQAVEKKVEEFERQKLEADRVAAEQAQETAKENYLANIGEIVQKDERFELIRARGAIQDVWDVTEEHFKQTGEIIPIETAADLVERYLEQEAEKLLSAKKIRDKLAPKPAQKPPLSGQQVNHGPRTLQNSLSAEAPVRDKPIEDLDEDSRLALAARILAGKAS
jgi:hypothetical protein